MAKRLIEKLRLEIDELRQLVNMNPHFDLREVQRAVGAVEEIVMSLREKELLKILAKKRGSLCRKARRLEE
jgi:5-methylthioribose kinase